MVGGTVGDGDTFFPVVFYSWLEYGGFGNRVYSCRGGGLHIRKCADIAYLHCRRRIQADMRSVFIFYSKAFKLCT